MEEQMDIIISATDNASDTFEGVAKTGEEMGSSLEQAFEEANAEVERLREELDFAEEWGFVNEAEELEEQLSEAEEEAKKLKDALDDTGEATEDLGDKSKSSGATMQMAFQNIADGVMRAKEGVVELGRNLMETLELAGQQQQQETFLKMNIGAEGAAKQMKIINDLVADLPGDDVAIGGLLSQAAAKNAGITADELKRMGVNAADYFAAMSNYGKSSAEAQQDLTNYILTGNTAELERSPILQAHIDKLKQATTVEERNKALQEAMNEEGWAGISQQDTYNNKLETFVAMLDRGKRQMGELFLGAASGAMDFIGNLDSATGGILGMGIAIGTVAGGPMIDLVTGVGQMATGLKALQAAFEGTAIATAIAEGGFWSMAAAELAALWPILAIIAALVAVGVAIYEVGKYFGWWSDVGTMLEAINAGVQRLWSAFINHPDVQGFIQGVSDAWAALQPFLTTVIDLVLKFFEVDNKSDFDLVRTLIDTISKAWAAMTLPIKTVIQVIKTLWNAFSTMYQKCKTALDNAKKAFDNFKEKVKKVIDNVKDKVKSITNIDISGVIDKIVQPFKDAYEGVKKQVEKIKKKAKEIPSNVGSAGLGVLGNFMGGEDLEFYGGSDLTSYSTEKLSVDMNQNINLSLDLRNVPSSMDERQLAGLINETLDSKEFINRLVNNPDFQSLDNKVKQRIVLKSNRANGRGV